MANIFDYVAKLPTDVLLRTEITNSRVTMPTVVNIEDFYKEFGKEIDVDESIVERNIYRVSSIPIQKERTARDMLSRKLRFK